MKTEALKQELMFPLAAAVNFFSVTGLMILSGVFGDPGLAADIAIIQAAVLAVFLALSANARNIILAADSSALLERDLFYFRILAIVPASIAVYLLTSTALDPPWLLLFALVLRKSTEWIVELQLANHEKRNNFRFAFRYVLVNTILFLAIAITLLIPEKEHFFFWLLCVWALIPLLFAIPYLAYAGRLGFGGFNYTALVPHMGSTVAIGVSTYVFRLLVILLAGKSLAGQMFTAYALGGMLSSIYVYAVGPSLVMRARPVHVRMRYVIVIACSMLGAGVIAASSLADNAGQSLFVLALGISLLGSSIMIIAQHWRLIILQVSGYDVFVPDALANILLISSIPFAFYLIGKESLAFFYLWSASLSCAFYYPLHRKSGIV